MKQWKINRGGIARRLGILMSVLALLTAPVQTAWAEADVPDVLIIEETEMETGAEEEAPLPLPEETEIPAELPVAVPEEPSPEPSPDVQAPPAELQLGTYTIPSVMPGETFILSIPLELLYQRQLYRSDLEGQLPGTFDPMMATRVDSAVVAVSMDQAGDLPLEWDVFSIAGEVIHDGENSGYAILSGLRVREDAPAGEYTLPITVTWRENTPEAETRTLVTSVTFMVMEAIPEETPGMDILDAGNALLEPEAYSVPWGEDGIIVYTFAELRSAVTSGRYATIYLGYDETNQGTISFTDGSGIAIPRSMTLDGTDPLTDRRMTLVDRNSQDALAVLYAAADGISVTVRNINYTGHNYYSVVNGAGRSNVTTHYVNVTYTGRQLSHNYGPGSTTTVTDCTVTLQNIGSGAPHELAETTGITFYGNTTVTQTGTTSNALLWTKNTGEHRITIAEGAHVTLTTSNYMLFPDPSDRAKIEVYGTLELTTTGPNGSLTYADSYAGSVTVYGSGVFTIDHRSAVWPTMNVANLTVYGTLRIRRNSSATAAAIRLQAGGSLTFSSPRLVELENAGGALIRTNTGTAAMAWTTPVINRHAKTTELAVWNNADLSAFTVNLTAGTTGATVTGVSGLENANRGAAIEEIVLASATVGLMSSDRLVLGPMALSLDAVASGQSIITGSTSADAIVQVSEYGYAENTVGEKIQGVTTMVGGDGGFSATLTPVRGSGTRVYARSDNGTLVCYTYATPVPGGPSFLEVPETLAFETVRLSGEDQIIHRTETDWSLSVYDARTTGNGFALYGRMESPLVSSSGDVLEDGLLFVQGDMVAALERGNVLIARGDPADGKDTYRLSWPVDAGLLARLPAYQGVPGEAYTATIVWTLTEGP